MQPGEQALIESPQPSPGSANPALVTSGVLLALVIALVLAFYMQRENRSVPLSALPPPSTPPEDHESADRMVTDPGRIVPELPPPPSLGSLFQSALARSRDVLRSGLDRVFGRPLDPAAFEALEETLLRADVGVPTTEALLKRVRAAAQAGADPQSLRGTLKAEMRRILVDVHRPLVPPAGLWVVLVVGVNGSGKTTTIGKLAARLRGDGRKVLVAAGDTFRAAAEQQLAVWAERAGAELVALEQGADPGAVAYTAVERAKSQGFDVVLVDTAGRLQTKKPLMEQLGKVRRVLEKALPGAPHETLLVLDGTMGQNAMSQAKLFHEVTQLSGVVVTKLDGTAKGGMVLAIATELGLPVKLVGLGEKVQDLREFDPDAFVDALA